MPHVAKNAAKAAAALLCGTFLLGGCTSPAEEAQSTASDRQAKVMRYGYSNLVNGQHIVSRFCLRGGPFDSNPSASGPFGFSRVDTLHLEWQPDTKVTVHDVATGEGNWWRILFDVDRKETHAFFINGRLRMASCGERGLDNLRAQFRPDQRPLVGDGLATAVFRIKPGTYVQDVSDQPDDVVCGLAVSQRFGIWESAAGYSVYVAEAQARGFTPQSCVALVRNGAS